MTYDPARIAAAILDNAESVSALSALDAKDFREQLWHLVAGIVINEYMGESNGTPPPDIDLELWQASASRIEAWSPSTLFLTHFGPRMTVVPHLRTLVDNLSTLSGLVQSTLARAGTDEERRAQFVEELRRELRRQMNETQAMAYEAASPLDLLWLGLARYWRKRG